MWSSATRQFAAAFQFAYCRHQTNQANRTPFRMRKDKKEKVHASSHSRETTQQHMGSFSLHGGRGIFFNAGLRSGIGSGGVCCTGTSCKSDSWLHIMLHHAHADLDGFYKYLYTICMTCHAGPSPQGHPLARISRSPAKAINEHTTYTQTKQLIYELNSRR
jgi:hypothetical protein